ncbi:MAG: hypothetical protein ACO3JL_20470 [Myxococcota bacterium]
MTVPSMLLVGFFGVVLLQVTHRLLGAVAAIMWCFLMKAHGISVLDTPQRNRIIWGELHSLQLAAFLGAMVAYHGSVLVRAWRLRRRHQRASR